MLFEACDPDMMTVASLGEAILRYYAPLLKDKYDDHPKRLRDLEHLITIMERYNRLEDFLADMALEPPNTSIDDTFTARSSMDQRLTLTTIHSAKGLEWHTVFVIWALDGRFPSVRALQNTEELEEELRLMYVATTRAQENLFITHPAQAYDRSTAMLLTQPSRFLDLLMMIFYGGRRLPIRSARKERFLITLQNTRLHRPGPSCGCPASNDFPGLLFGKGVLKTSLDQGVAPTPAVKK